MKENNSNIKMHKGLVYQSRPLGHGERPCENCAANDGMKHDYGLCEALLPCSAVNRTDGVGITWDKVTIGVDHAKPFSDATTVMSIEQTCTALAVRRCGYMMSVPNAYFVPLFLCRKCVYKLSSLYDLFMYDGIHSVYEVEKFDCVFKCELCGDGVDVEFKQLVEDWEMVEI